MRRIVCAVLAAGSCASGDVIYQTSGPFGGPFGLIGFDVFNMQSVGLRFTPDKDYALDRVGVWIMSNDFGGVSGALVEVTVRDDDNNGTVSIPGQNVLETMQFNVSAVGWNPVLEEVVSSARPILKAGVNYWIVLECDVPNKNPVWNWASSGTGFMSNTTGGQTQWQPGGMGAVAATIIEGTPVTCYPDCDGSGLLDLFDFLCFVNEFNAGDLYADCDGSGGLDLFDFLCFVNEFNAGCP